MDPISLPTLQPAATPLTDVTQLAARARSGDRKAIEEVAVGFEGVFASLLVKQMRQTLEPGALFGRDDSDILGGLFDHYLGQHLAQAKSLGIANLIQTQLTQQRRPA